jgi:hypothetical protein
VMLTIMATILAARSAALSTAILRNTTTWREDHLRYLGSHTELRGSDSDRNMPSAHNALLLTVSCVLQRHAAGRRAEEAGVVMLTMMAAMR